MHSLRRAALRAVSLQPARSASSLQCRAVFPSVARQIAPTAYRSFHQTRIWSSSEQKDNEHNAEPAQVEPSQRELEQEVVEKSITTPEVADAAEQSSSQQSTTEAITRKAQQLTGIAVNTVQNVAERFGATRVTPRPSSHVSESPGTLYVGNISFDATIEQLGAEFAQYGEVVKTVIISDNRGMSKGFGFVEFTNGEDAQRAIQEQNQRPFLGRQLTVQVHEPNSGAASRGRGTEARGNSFAQGNASRRPAAVAGPTSTLFIGNMSYQMSDRDLNDLFRDVVDVVDVRVAIDRRSGQPRGFAHADFIDAQAAERAKAHLESKVIYGRQLRVDFTDSAPRRRQTLTPNSAAP